MSKNSMPTMMSRRSFIETGCAVTGVAAAAALGATTTAYASDASDASESAKDTAAANASSAGAAAQDSETLLPNLAGLEYVNKPVEGEVAYVADPIDDSQIVDTVACDVVICGAGMAGISAAVSATENGLNTVLLEKGGVFAARGSEIGVFGDRVHAEAGIELDPNQYVNDALATAHFRCDREVWQRFANRCGEAMDWAIDKVGDACGSFYCTGGNTEFAGVTTWGTSVRMENGIYSFVEAMEAKAREQGADIRYETPAVQLVKEGDAVTGVIAKGEDGYIKFVADKGVVLATGGYEHNWDLLTQRIRPRDLAVYGWLNPTTTDTGDGLLMGKAVGALEDDWPHILMNDPAGAKDGNRANALFLAFLRVNANGKRFVNENLSFEYLCNAIMYQPGAHDYAIMAGDILSAIDVMKGAAPWSTQDMYDAIKDILVQADTLEELAEKCGIDAENLAATVERYNELCAQGTDDDFGKNPNALIALEEGPYYALEESGDCLVTVNGLRTDSMSRVLDVSCKPIVGLYALGNVSGSMFFGTYPHHMSGVSHGRCLTFGYLVGRTLAGFED